MELLAQLDINLALVAGVAAIAGIALGLVAGLGLSQSRSDAMRRAHREELTSCQEAAEARQAEDQARAQNLRDNMQAEVAALQAELSAMRARSQEREAHYQAQIGQLKDHREDLKKEFEHLANRIFDDKGKRFSDNNRQSMEALLKPFREQIHSFQSRINEVHDKSVASRIALEKEIGRVLEVGLQMNDQASNLTQALKGDKKAAGNWGEAQLERTLQLAGLESGDHYQAQAAFRDDEGQRKYPDFIVKLPDGKHLVIDSKVSLVDYDRAITADTEEAQTEALSAHAQAVRNHIDNLAGKDYANLPDLGSPDFVLMFMPIEPAYIEALKHNRDLFNYGYQQGVIMVSHTTLMPILRTVANLWMVERSNTEAREISASAGDIYNSVCLVAERLQKLGNTLKTTEKQYNDTVTALVGRQGLIGKVDRFQAISTKARKDMPKLEPLQTDVEVERLTLESVEEPAPTEH
jgi:DNA recombination protein RmuC